MAPKKKQEKMSLGNFLSDQSLGSWADEMEDMPMPSQDSRTSYGRDQPRREYQVPDFGAARDRDAGGFGGGDRDRPAFHREPLPLPTKPPYTAHLGNLSYEVTSADVESLFTGCQVTSVRLLEDKIERKPKGFGYVEFGTLEGLKQALTFNGSQFQGRNVRVSVADPPKDRGGESGREFNDWTRKGPLPDLPSRRPSDRGFRSFDAASDAGSERSMSRKGFGAEGDGKSRDLSSWERKGPLSPVPGAAVPGGRDGGRVRDPARSFERKPSPAWGEGRTQEGSRPPRPQAERQPTAADLDNQWRARMKPDAPAAPATPVSEDPDASTPTSPVAAATAPAVRPRLNLQKRTVSEAPTEASTASATDSKASPFGAARPIDSATREKEIEEKRLALRQKRDEEEKVAESKKQSEKPVKGEPRVERGPKNAVQENGRAAPKDKESGASSPTAGRQYEILRRMQHEEGATEEDTEPGENANGNIIGDREVHPKEVVRDPATGETSQSTTEGLEDDGWEKVPAKGRGKRPGQTTARALAS